MPGRYTIALILAFFVGMVSWQWIRNNGLASGEGPQLKASLELAAQDGITNWKISYNQKRLGIAQTQVVKTPDGIYRTRQQVDLDGDLESFLGPISAFAKLSGIKLNDFTATIRTNMDLTYLGTMKKMGLIFTARPRPVVVLPGTDEEKRMRPTIDLRRPEKEETGYLLKLDISGLVLLTDELSFRGSFDFGSSRFPIDDVKMKYRSKDAFFSNIAPTDCLANIYLGQRWQAPVIDPTQLMVGALATSKAKEISNGAFNADDLVKTKVTEVRVLDELKVMDWDNAQVQCLVVQSNERGTKMQIWVNRSTYRVLKQTIESDRYQLEIIREPKKEE